jgi:hypothetical protein
MYWYDSLLRIEITIIIKKNCSVWFFILPILTPFLIAFVFCIPSLYYSNLNTHLLPGTSSHLRLYPNSEVFTVNFLPYSMADFFVGVCSITCEGILARLYLPNFISVGDIAMPSSLLMYLRIKSVVFPYLISSFSDTY